MILEEGIVAHLKADAPVFALVASRIYTHLPQAVTYPAIEFSRISVDRFNTLDGPSDLVNARIQVVCWAATYAVVKDLATKVRQALNGVATTLGGVAIQRLYFSAGETDRVDILEDRKDYSVSFDFICALIET